jgi:GH35 family endo-1,4-beta-xylanase
MSILAVAAEGGHRPLRRRANGRAVGFSVDRATIVDPGGDAVRRNLGGEGTMIVPADLHYPGLFPAPDTENWTAVDIVNAWAGASGLRLHPHCYHDGDGDGWPLPNWMSAAVEAGDAANAEAILRAAIAAIGAHIPESALALVTLVGEALADEPNEPVLTRIPGPPGTGIYLRRGPFGRKLTYDQLGIAFGEARLHWPNAELILNDYHLEYNPARMDACLTLVEWMVGQGIPIDGVGIECHATPWLTYTPAVMAAFVDDLGALGVAAHLTEIDINDDPAHLPADPAARWAEQATFLTEILDIYLPLPNLKSVTFWGVNDTKHYLYPDRGDGLVPSGTLYDVENAPTPLYAAAAAAIERHWGAGA